MYGIEERKGILMESLYNMYTMLQSTQLGYKDEEHYLNYNNEASRIPSTLTSIPIPETYKYLRLHEVTSDFIQNREMKWII